MLTLKYFRHHFLVQLLRNRKILKKETIISKLNLSIVRKIAQKRNSASLNNICLPTESFFSIIHLPRIHRRVMDETSSFRNEDRIDRRIDYLNENRNGIQLNTNIPKKKKIKKAKPFSVQKRQILISEAFLKMQNKPHTATLNYRRDISQILDYK